MKAESKKRPRESDAVEVEGEGKPPGKEKKKSKKQKTEAVNAVTTGTGSTKTNGEAKQADKKRPQMVDHPSGLKLADVKIGEGVSAKKGDVVEMRYIGKFEDGKVFDSNTKGRPVC